MSLDRGGRRPRRNPMGRVCLLMLLALPVLLPLALLHRVGGGTDRRLWRETAVLAVVGVVLLAGCVAGLILLGGW